jgi:hypothetical protein
VYLRIGGADGRHQQRQQQQPSLHICHAVTKHKKQRLFVFNTGVGTRQTFVLFHMTSFYFNTYLTTLV